MALATTTAATASATSPASSMDWTDIGKQVLLDLARSVTGRVAGKISSELSPGPTSAEELLRLEQQKQAEEAARTRQMLLWGGVIAVAVLGGALLLRR